MIVQQAADMFQPSILSPDVTAGTTALDSQLLDAAEDDYAELGLLTPPWSPCDSSMSTDDGDDAAELLLSTVADTVLATLRPRCDSFLCSCMSCGDCSCAGPVLRDCMWSQTTGLLPIIRPNSCESQSDSKPPSPPCCPTIASICTNHTDRCVDPKSVFPYHVDTRSAPLQTSNSSNLGSTAMSPPVYDPDSETSAYCSSPSDDDELEEIDVVSLTSTSPTNTSSPDSGHHPDLDAADPEPVLRRRMLVLPAAESMSAQVAAMHNYSNPRCPAPVLSRPAATTQLSSATSVLSFTASTAKRYVSSSRVSSRPKRRPRRQVTAAPSPAASASDSSEDSGVSVHRGSAPFSSASVLEERYRRAQHNVMERQRRHHLKGNFYGLRDAVPGTRGDGRVSKVAILRRAVDHIRNLTSVHNSLQAELSRLQSLQKRWKWKLSLVSQQDVHSDYSADF